MAAALRQAYPQVSERLARPEQSTHRWEQRDEQQPDASTKAHRALAKLADEQEAAPTGARQPDGQQRAQAV